MPTLNDLVRSCSDLSPPDLEWLHLLVGDWQMLSDLSFADLVLWVPARSGDYLAVAHCRPTTGITVHHDDVVGSVLPQRRRAQVETARREVRIYRAPEPEWYEDVPVREEAIPVVHEGRALAVLARQTNLAAARTPSRLELAYQQCADDLARMVATGAFPLVGAPTGPRRGAPRVGDGMVRLDADGVVTYASPNALSGFHRLGLGGELVGRSLAEVTTGELQSRSPVDESLALVVTGRAPWRTDVEGRGSVLSLRAVPLVENGVRTGALLLCRDVSELRRRERELMTKDATIREIHHRVKNNLQTVAALLRLQARRIGSDEGKAALEEAMRRVGTIALVHETLSQGFDEAVDFDQVVDRGLALAADAASQVERACITRQGAFGTVLAEDATPLALVLTELVTNAVEHGLGEHGGTVVVRPRREGTSLRVSVLDDGAGVPETFVPGRSGLGTQIVQALLGGELAGRIDWRRRPGGGTEVTLDVRLREVNERGRRR